MIVCVILLSLCIKFSGKRTPFTKILAKVHAQLLSFYVVQISGAVSGCASRLCSVMTMMATGHEGTDDRRLQSVRRAVVVRLVFYRSVK